MYEIEEALKRIEKGTYGVCELTNKPIPRARLEAIPWTRFTVTAHRTSVSSFFSPLIVKVCSSMVMSMSSRFMSGSSAFRMSSLPF